MHSPTGEQQARPAASGRRRPLRTVLIVVGVVFLLCCAAPLGATGIRYAVLDSGPYENLGDVCGSLVSPKSKAFVGDVRVDRDSERGVWFGKEPFDVVTCTWDGLDTPTGRKVTLRASVGRPSVIGSDARVQTRQRFELWRRAATRYAGEYEGHFYRAVDDLGDDAFVQVVPYDLDKTRITLQVLRDNLLIEVTVAGAAGLSTAPDRETADDWVPEFVRLVEPAVIDVTRAVPRDGE